MLSNNLKIVQRMIGNVSVTVFSENIRILIFLKSLPNTMLEFYALVNKMINSILN